MVCRAGSHFLGTSTPHLYPPLAGLAVRKVTLSHRRDTVTEAGRSAAMGPALPLCRALFFRVTVNWRVEDTRAGSKRAGGQMEEWWWWEGEVLLPPCVVARAKWEEEDVPEEEAEVEEVEEEEAVGLGRERGRENSLPSTSHITLALAVMEAGDTLRDSTA